MKTVGGFPGSTSPTASLPSLLLPPHGQLQRVTLVSEKGDSQCSAAIRYKSRLSLQSPKCCCLGRGAYAGSGRAAGGRGSLEEQTDQIAKARLDGADAGVCFRR